MQYCTRGILAALLLVHSISFAASNRYQSLSERDLQIQTYKNLTVLTGYCGFALTMTAITGIASMAPILPGAEAAVAVMFPKGNSIIINKFEDKGGARPSVIGLSLGAALGAAFDVATNVAMAIREQPNPDFRFKTTEGAIIVPLMIYEELYKNPKSECQIAIQNISELSKEVSSRLSAKELKKVNDHLKTIEEMGELGLPPM